MNFLTPLFFAGLAAVAVPILVHLIHRERKDVIEFPSLMFLRKIPYRTVRRQKIRHWLLLALRCAALALIVMAFARPFLGRDIAGTTVTGSRELVILLDRSYSMGYGDRWTRAVASARRTIDAMAPGDRATLVPFADGPQAATTATQDRAALVAALAPVKLSSGGTHYAPALKLAQKTLEASKLPRREVVLITDFQKVAWDGHADVRLPPGTVLTRVDLSDKTTSNVSVTSVELRREYEQGREKVGATARLTNKGAKPVDKLAVSLDLGGRTVETKSVTLAPNSAATVIFNAFPLPDGFTRGSVRAAPDALPQDNTFFFALSRGQAISVLVLESAAGARGPYLSRALGIGGRPPFRVMTKPISKLAADDLTGRSLVVLDDAGFPQGDAGRRLAQWVREGGGLLVILGDRASPASWSGAVTEHLLPGAVGAPVDLGAPRGGTLGYLDRSHPVFELFSAPRSGDFSAARVLRYRKIEMPSDTGIVARYDDGAPALIDRRVGDGKVVIFTSTLDTYWNDLAVQPVFLPFVHSLAKYSARYAEDQPWYTVGKVLDVRGLFGRDEPEVVVTSPSGAKSRMEGGKSVAGGRAVELSEQGFYELRTANETADEAHLVAVNLDPAESDLSAVDPEEMAAAITAPPGAVATAGTGAPLTIEDRERNQRIWWYLLIGAFALLAAETVLSNRLSRRTAASTR